MGKTQVEYQREYRQRQSGLSVSICQPADIERREFAKESVMNFAQTYFAPLLYLAPAKMHHELAENFQTIILHGGRSAVVAPRGSGKTTWCMIALTWAIVYGHRRFAVYACETHDLADKRLAIIRSWFERGIHGDRTLLDDFPEIAIPVAALDGRPQRTGGLVIDGNPSGMRWTSSGIVFPDSPGSPSALSSIVSTGLTAGVRGSIDALGRPDYVIIDDPMGDEAAGSAGVIKKRRKNIDKGLAYLGGLGKSLAMNMLATIIEKGDVGDQYTDQKEKPAWNGKRYKFIENFPEKIPEEWNEYISLWSQNRDDDKYARRAHEYYLANRQKLDGKMSETMPLAYEGRHVIENGEQLNVLPDGSEVESSAIQHAFNVIAKDGLEVFMSEFQNDPPSPIEDHGNIIEADIYALAQVGLKRGYFSHRCEKLTAFIDVQKNCLVWAVCAWEPGFTGYVVDFGMYPQQGNLSFSTKNLTVQLSKKHPGGQEAQWRGGLEAVSEQLLGQEWKRDDGASMRITRLLIDANEGQARQTIFDFARQSKWPSIVMPSIGRAITAASIPFSEYRRKPGEVVGENWRIPSPAGKVSPTRYIYSDINYWKTFFRARVFTPLGDPGHLVFFGSEKNGNRATLQSVAEHCTAEYGVATEGRGRKVTEWKVRPNREEHLFDCLVGCMIGASEQKIILGEKIGAKSNTGARSGEERMAALRGGR